MKRFLAVILCLVLMAPALGQAASSAAVVNNPNPKDRLNLREQPSTTAASLGKYYNGTPVTILSSAGDGWVKVSIGAPGYALEGYVMKKYLATGSAASKVKSAMPEYMSGSSSWEIYRNQDTGSESDTYGYGLEIRLMGFTEQWWHIAILRNGKLSEMGFVPANSLNALLTAVVCNPNPKDRLNLRVSNSQTAASLGKYYNGTKVLVLGYYYWDQTWLRVRIDKTEGFMLEDYLKLGADAAKVKNAMPTVKVTASKAVLREKASTGSTALASFKKGTSVKVWGLCGSWLHVQVGGKMGYMLASGLSKVPQ